MLAVAPQLGGLPLFFAVFAAVLAVLTALYDGAIASRVRALKGIRHGQPPPVTLRLSYNAGEIFVSDRWWTLD
jgi:hypothetical protein